MMEVKHSGSNFLKMQVKMSEKSLQSFRSDSSFSCSSARTDTTSAKERGLKYVSRSPLLRKLSTASFSVDTQSLQRDEPSPSRSITPVFSCLPEFMNKNEFELNTLVQCALLIAVASQLGDLLDEIIEIIELHLHTFPVLVVLGVLPKIFLKKQNVRMSASFGSQQRNGSLISLSSVNILRDIEKYYASNGGEDASSPDQEMKSPPQLHRHVPTPTNQGDEWGHFADFDDGMDVPGEEGYCLPPDLGSRAALSPLHETEIDE